MKLYKFLFFIACKMLPLCHNPFLQTYVDLAYAKLRAARHILLPKCQSSQHSPSQSFSNHRAEQTYSISTPTMDTLHIFTILLCGKEEYTRYNRALL